MEAIRISSKDKNIRKLLRDLEVVKNLKGIERRICRCEELTHTIVQSLRKSNSAFQTGLNVDTLLQTTSIWVLMHLLRLDDIMEDVRKIMLSSGVPGVLSEILKGQELTGSTRQYASELCYYLCSQDRLPPPELIPPTGPIELPEIYPLNRYSIDKGSVGINGRLTLEGGNSIYSEISLGSDNAKQGVAFVPYRLNNRNNVMLDSLFQTPDPERDHLQHMLAGKLNTSRYGFGTHDTGDDSNNVDYQSNDSSTFRPDLWKSNSYETKLVSTNSFDVVSGENSHYSESAISPMRESLSYSSVSSTANWKEVTQTHSAHSSTSSNQFKDILYPRLPNSLSNGDWYEKSQNNRDLYKLAKLPDNLDGVEDTVGLRGDLMKRHLAGSISSATRLDKKKRHDGDYGHSSSHPFNQQPFSSSVHPNQSRAHSRDLMRASSTPSMSSTFPAAAMRKRALEFSGESPSGITDYLAHLDPLSLSVNIGLKSLAEEARLNHQAMMNVSEYDEDDEDDDDENEHDSISSRSVDERESESDGIFTRRRKIRIRAEKLIDLSFMNSLFVKGSTLADAQDLTRRMEDMLYLIDKDKTGYCTWEEFARVIIILAPQKLLRADVLAFLEAQTDDNQAQIDYREFLISGKAMIVGKTMGRSALPINGWLERQKQITGDASTYTWKNHVKWFSKRKSEAVIWLMRRGARALTMGDRNVKAQEYLLKQAKRGFALSYLMEVGYNGLKSQELRIEAKRHLLMRCFHARKWNLVVIEAQRYLAMYARNVIIAMELAEEGEALTSAAIREKLSKMLAIKAKQADYATLFRMQQARKVANIYLMKVAKKALLHSAHQDEVLLTLIHKARKVIIQLQVSEQTQSWLIECAEKANNYLNYQEEILTSLLSKGERALSYLNRQMDALPWLIEKGRFCRDHSSHKDATVLTLMKLGRFTLWFLNRREHAFHYLCIRGANAIEITIKKEEAIKYLRRLPQAVWDQEEFVAEAQRWLVVKGSHALKHKAVQHIALKRLMYAGGRASGVKRRLDIAFSDLTQVANLAKFKEFETVMCPKPVNVQRLIDEQNRILRSDIRYAQIRASLKRVQRWKIELKDAFAFACRMCTRTTPQDLVAQKEDVIGRYGFRRLLCDGRLLGLTSDSIDEYFNQVDTATGNFINFDQLWIWFHHEAKKKNREGGPKKPFEFTVKDIFTAQERAHIGMFRRLEQQDAGTFLEGLANQIDEGMSFFRKQGSEASGLSESESSEDEQYNIDELDGDEFGDDLNGQLMTLLTLVSD